ncbi:MAG: excinuclease ABC subunit UvrC [Eubacteriales bacterium]|nr:excinuclease ABC subunit UvrC [Eubacteriales bacterium]
MNEQLELKINTLPDTPGCYLMKQNGNIIYVGKALNLKNRVRSYFQKGDHSPKVAAMVPKIDDFDIMLCSSELEALMLECNLIKEHRPYYNVLLKDDKHYPYLRINMQEDFPRVTVVRRVKKDGAMYFGPYLSTYGVRRIFTLLGKIFPLRTCNHKLPLKNPIRPCLKYEIGQCPAPCANKCSSEEYKKIAWEVVSFLQGKYKPVKQKLKEGMQEAALNMQYERAAEFRDAMEEVDKLMEQQNVSNVLGNEQDIIALYQDGLDAYVQVLFIRQGRMTGGDSFLLEREGSEKKSEVLRAFLLQFYQKHKPAREVIVEELDDTEVLNQWLRTRRDGAVKLTVPKRGTRLRLVEMAVRNAKDSLEKHALKSQVKYERTIGAGEELAKALNIGLTLRRIEGFDISHSQGKQSVASMVVFINGEADRKEYRRFNINRQDAKDDLVSMAEAINRRFAHSFPKDGSTAWPLPDIVLIDGGPEQLKVAIKAMREAGGDVPMFALSEKQEEIWLPDKALPVILDRRSPALHLVQRIRDEAHRFAITSHRQARGKKALHSRLEDIKGIGPNRRRALLAKFRSIEGIKNASLEEIMQVDGMSRPAAEALYKAFHG